jgi:hypothetical protein
MIEGKVPSRIVIDSTTPILELFAGMELIKQDPQLVVVVAGD